MYEIALARISDFLSDADSPFVDFCAPPEMVLSNARNLAFMLVRYRFSMTLWAARLAALRALRGCVEPAESFDRVLVIAGVDCAVGSVWSCGTISGVDAIVETESRLLSVLWRRHGSSSIARARRFEAGMSMTCSAGEKVGHVGDHNWSSLSRSWSRLVKTSLQAR